MKGAGHEKKRPLGWFEHEDIKEDIRHVAKFVDAYEREIVNEMLLISNR